MNDLCECGCGAPTPIASYTSAERGWVKGQPKRYIHGHNRRCKPPAIERFTSRYEIDPESECWLWTGHINPSNGYGCFNVVPEVGVYVWTLAHRWSYEHFVGPIPEGLTIDHVRARGCRHRHCVNPAHLEVVTRGENSIRGDGPTGVNARKTHCVNGHPFDEENTYRPPCGGRQCRACRRLRRVAATDLERSA